MILSTSYADGSVVHGSDVDSWTFTINALAELIVPSAYSLVAGFASTATSATSVTLTATSPGLQAFTGNVAQIVVLPTTSVTADMAWLIVNGGSATITVNASGGATVGTVAAGEVGVFAAVTATPTTAAGWSTNFQQTLINPVIQGYTETVQSLGTIGATATIGPLRTGTKAAGTLTASTASAITLPTIPAGEDLVVYLTQCASGTGGTYTFTAASGQTLKWAGGTAPTATATNGKIDILVFTSPDGTSVLGVPQQNF